MNTSPTSFDDQLSLSHKIIYGVGAFVNNLLAAAIGGMVIVLNLGLGINPALVGLMSAIPRLTDALTDPLIGYLSDKTSSRWGRRRPFIFIGAVSVGIIYALLWQLPVGKSETYYFWYFLIGSLLFYLAYTVFVTPWVALGYELTGDYHERTRLMGVQNFMGQFAYVIAPWFLLFMQNEVYFKDMVEGAKTLAIIIGLVVIIMGILPALFLRERFSRSNGKEAKDKPLTRGALRKCQDFFKGFTLTLQVAPFLKLCAATFLVFNGFIMVSSFQSYVIIYYVFSGDTVAGAKYAGYAGTLGAVSTFAVIVFVTWLATHLGKLKAFHLATGISVFGYVLKWWFYTPDQPWLLLVPVPLIAFGLGALFTLMPSMIADVVDFDEISTFKRREGMFGSIFWWVVKLGMAVALALGGYLLNATGFDVALAGNQNSNSIISMRLMDAFVPAFTSLIAMLIMFNYALSEEKVNNIRNVLEQRRLKP